VWLPFIQHQKNNMKKLIYILLLLLGLLSYSQTKGIFSKDPIINLENFDKQRLYWGYFLGFNTYDFKFDYINLFYR
jgi:hypothetical protein